jgi:hypothetical protein
MSFSITPTEYVYHAEVAENVTNQPLYVESVNNTTDAGFQLVNEDSINPTVKTLIAGDNVTLTETLDSVTINSNVPDISSRTFFPLNDLTVFNALKLGAAGQYTNKISELIITKNNLSRINWTAALALSNLVTTAGFYQVSISYPVEWLIELDSISCVGNSSSTAVSVADNVCVCNSVVINTTTNIITITMVHTTSSNFTSSVAPHLVNLNLTFNAILS